jgi:hypothetical protein
MVITSAADSTFDKVGIGVENSSIIAISGEDSNSV